MGKAANRDQKGCPRLENLTTNIKKRVSTQPREEGKGWTGHPWAVVSIGTKQPAEVKPGSTKSERKLVRRGHRRISQVSKEIGSGDCRVDFIYAGAWSGTEESCKSTCFPAQRKVTTRGKPSNTRRGGGDQAGRQTKTLREGLQVRRIPGGPLRQ